jgi:hypothetical protein
VRKQIKTETLTVLPSSFAAVVPNPPLDREWIGVGTINDEVVLLAGIGNYVVFFPPADDPDLYSRLPSSFKGTRVNVVGPLPLGPDFAYGEPTAVLYKERLVVVPDVCFRGVHLRLLVIPESGGQLQIMFPVRDEEFEELRRLYPEGGSTITSRMQMPKSDTGR